MLIMAIAPGTAFAYDDSVKIKDVMAEQEFMDLIMQMLVDNQAYADTQFFDTESRMPNTGYFGIGGPGKGQGIRGTNNYALLYAFLYQELPDSKYPKDGAFKKNLKEKAIKAIRYGIFTHNAVKKMTCTTNNAYWGPPDWQSSLQSHTLLFAAHLMWDEFDEQMHKDIEAVAVAEGNRGVNTAPAGYTTGNTGAEENAWDTNGPSIAYNMFPQHPNAQKWREASIKFAMNSLSRKADMNDPTIVDGKPASEWITKWNIFDDYALENHNILHPTYQMSPNLSFADSAVYYAYFDHELPDGFKYNVEKSFNRVLKTLVYPTGEWIYPNACDWTLILPGNIEPIAYMSILFQDPEAKLMETRLIQMARQRQLLSGDGRLVHLSDIGVDREAVESKRLMYTYLLHKYVGDWPEENVTWEELVENNAGTTTYLDDAVIVDKNINRFVSFSWKNKYMGLITPDSNEYIAQGYITQPNLPNVVGTATIAGTSGRTYGSHINYNGANSFSTIGYLNENTNKTKRYLAMTALPNNAVVLMESLQAQAAVSVTANNSFPLSFQTDIISGKNKTITTQAGADSFEAGPGINRTYKGDWVDVDGHTTVLLDQERNISFGGYALSAQIGGSTLSFANETGNFTTGQTISKATNIVLSNVGAEQAQALKEKVRYLEMPDGWGGVLLYDTDGTQYYVVNQFYGADGTVSVQGDTYGAPVMLQNSSINGSTATVQLSAGPMASSYGPLSKFAKTADGETLKAFNSVKADTFYLYNDDANAREADATFLSNGTPVTKKVNVEPGKIYEIVLRGAQIVVTEIDSLPHKPIAPQSVSAATSGEAVDVSWTNTADNISLFVIERAEPYGKFSEIARTSASQTSYKDTTVAPVGTYYYRVSSIDTEGLYRSDATESGYASVGNFVEENGSVNLALGKFAQQKQYDAANPPSNAVDGKTDTFCHSLATDMSVATPVDLIVDLGAVYTIDRVVQLPRVSYGPKDAKIYGSTDGKTYKPIGSKTFANSQDVTANTLTFAKTDARYVKFDFTSSYDSKNRGLAQVAEIRIYEASKLTPVSAPQNVAAEAKAHNAVALTWTDASDDETGFIVERKTQTGTWQRIAALPSNATSYMDTTALGETAYQYRIGAVRASVSAYSAEAGVTTPQNLQRNVALGVKEDALTVESSLENTTYSKNYLTDGDVSKGWVSDRAVDNPITPDSPLPMVIDLGSVYSVGKLRLYPYLPDANRLFGVKDFELWTSVDGTNFLKAGEYTLTAVRDWSTVLFPATDARYVKVVIKTGYDPAAADARNVHIREIEIHTAQKGEMVLAEMEASIDNVRLDMGKTAQINTRGLLNNGEEAADGFHVAYMGYDPSVVSIDSAGRVTTAGVGTTAVQVVGEYKGAYLTKQLSITVQNYIPLSALSLSTKTLSVEVGTRQAIRAVPEPAETSERKVIWTINGSADAVELYRAGTDERIVLGAETDALALDVKGVARGSLELCVKSAANTEKMAACSVNVRQAEDVAPAMPKDLKGEAQTGNQIKLTWTDASNNETGFVVERKQRGENWTEIARLAQNSTQYVDATCVGGRDYFYRIGARNDFGTTYSAERIVRSTISVENLTIDQQEINVKTGFLEALNATFTPQDAGNQQVVWTVPSGAQNIVLYRAGTTQEVPLDQATNVRAVDVKGVKIGAASITVSSVEKPALSRQCTVNVTAGAPDAPEDVNAEAISVSAVRLTWKITANDASSVVVERMENTGSWNKLAELAAGPFSEYYDDSVSAGIEYSYRVGAKNDMGVNYGKTVTVKPNQPQEVNLAQGRGGSYLTVSSSTETGTYKKDNLTDGNRTTAWVSKSEALYETQAVTRDQPQEIVIELEKTGQISRVELYPNFVDTRFFGPKELSILVSEDGTTFTPTTAADVNLPETSLVNKIEFTPVTAKYVKLLITAAWDRLPSGDKPLVDPGRNVHIREVEIYGYQPIFTAFEAKAQKSVIGKYETTSILLSNAVSELGQAMDLSKAQVSYTGYDPKVVRVDANGTVTGAGDGTTKIQVVAILGTQVLKREVEIKVVYTPVQKITLSGADQPLVVSGRDALRASVEPNDADDARVVWTVTSGANRIALYEAGTKKPIPLGAPTDVLEVDAAGIAAGEAVVVATSYDVPGVSAQKTYTVVLPPLPAAPQNLTAVASDGRVSLQWDAVAGYVDGYRIYMDSGSGFVKYGSDIAGQTTAAVTGLQNGTTYRFAVVAYNAAGEGTRSAAEEALPKIAATGIVVSPQTMRVAVGDKKTLSVSVQPANATFQDYTLQPEDESIVRIGAKNSVEGLKPGTTVIRATARDGSFSAQCSVTVFQAVEQINLEPKKKTIDNKQSFRIAAAVLPQDAEDTTLVWRSMNEAVATVDQTGEVTAHAKGTALITATAADRNTVFASCTVTVRQPATGIRISMQEATLALDGQQQLQAVLTPNDAEPENITWTSSDTSVATVTGSGLVRAQKTGSAEITAQTKDGRLRASCKVTVVRGTLISFRVEADGPVKGAVVTLGDTKYATDKTGSVTVRLIPGRYDYVVTKAGYQTFTGVLETGMEDKDCVVKLSAITGKKVPVSFVLKDAQGNPHRNMDVELHSVVQKAKTDQEGRVAFQNVEPGQHKLLVLDAAGNQVGILEFVLENGSAPGMTPATQTDPMRITVTGQKQLLLSVGFDADGNGVIQQVAETDIPVQQPGGAGGNEQRQGQSAATGDAEDVTPFLMIAILAGVAIAFATGVKKRIKNRQ